jgi:hypothetical protein
VRGGFGCVLDLFEEAIGSEDRCVEVIVVYIIGSFGGLYD